MHKASIEERQDFYRYKASYLIFDEAAEILSAIRAGRKTTPPVIQQALWLSFFLMYAKPFKQHKKKGLGLANDLVPPEFLDTHNGIITLRDKMYAHTDALDMVDSDNELLNSLVLYVDENGVPNFALARLTRTQETLAVYFELLQVLKNKCLEKAHGIWTNWSPNLSLDANVLHTINIRADSDEVLLRHPAANAKA